MAESQAESADLWTPTGKCSDLLSDQDKVVPFVGAGVSMAAGLPGSDDMRQALLDAFGEDTVKLALSGPLSEADVFDVADAIAIDAQKSREVRACVSEFWEDELAALSQDETQKLIAERLVRVPSKLILTFNYDDLLEEAADRQGIDYDSLGGAYDLSEVIERARQEPGDKLCIYHIHGSVRKPETIVLDKLGYQELGANGRITDLFRALLTSKRMCFLGTRFDETRHLENLLSLDSSGDSHPLFASAKDRQYFQRAKPRSLRHKIELCWLPTRDHMRGSRPPTDVNPPAP